MNATAQIILATGGAVFLLFAGFALIILTIERVMKWLE
jgi:hypothetical protein